ncbi:MAG: radical SAM protein [Chlamydiota bacterium]
MKVLLAVLPCERGQHGVQTDAVLARCASIASKAAYALPPLGLMYIGALLRAQGGFAVSLVDCAASRTGEKKFIRRLAVEAPDSLVCATGASTLAHDTTVLENVKAALPSIRIIAVGAHVTLQHEEVLTQSCVDYVVRGEPELTVAELAHALATGESCRAIEGLSYKEGGGVMVNPDRPLPENIDALPFPARDLVAGYRYSIPFAMTDNFTIMITSRGCPYPCIFCATQVYNGTRCRVRSAANVIAELEEIVHKFGIRDIGFWDDTFTLGRAHVLDICNRIIEKKLGVNWICLSRVDTVDAELLQLMRKAGCYQIQYGVESGDQGVLDALKKGITIDQVKKAFAATRRCGIETAAFFMLGCPGETVETMERTIKLSKELHADYASFNIVTPYPGTELYKAQKPNITETWNTFDAFHVSTNAGLQAEVIEKYLRKAYLNFYFNPRYLLRRLRSISSFKKLMRQLQTGVQLFSRWVPREG